MDGGSEPLRVSGFGLQVSGFRFGVSRLEFKPETLNSELETLVCLRRAALELSPAISYNLLHLQ
jgi:hypothetical protein